MSELENSRMTALLKKLRGDICSIEEVRNARLFKEAGADLQEVYKLHLSAKKYFAEADYFLQSLYRSYNFAAAVISEAVKKKIPINEVGQLDECLETMIDCCDEIIKRLNKRK